MSRKGAFRWSALARSGSIVAGVVAVLFVFVEGASSTLLVLNELIFHSRRPLAERAHSRYDPLLGWTNLPNFFAPDLYGPGIHFRTNSQSFRGDRDFPSAVPEGKTRIVCSGDSFTLGYGVDNDHAWCQILSSLEPGLETVNMGQGGYGLDQVYLWYRREGTVLGHDLQLLAFITEDFLRMERDEFFGYGKPVLRVEKGRLVTANVPVPRRSFYFPWLTQNAPVFARLRSIQLIEGGLRKLLPKAPGPAADSTHRRCREIASKIFEALRDVNHEKQSVLVLIYLPVESDYQGAEADPWREFVRGEARRLGVPFFDLVEEIRRLPPGEVRRMFQDHYTIEGNRVVAGLIDAKLRAHPATSARLLPSP